MNASINQAVTMFEELEMSPEQIARDLEFDVASVKAVLLQHSMIYRQQVLPRSPKAPVNPALDFTDEELVLANQVIVQCMQQTDDPYLAGQMARYIREDKKGRRDVKKALSNVNYNLTNISLQFQKANEALAKARGAKVIEMAESDTKQLEEVKK